MPRIRSLKYEYFINEDLAQISLEARLLGLGITTLADREGRLEDRPLRIKVLLFPYHEVDVDAAINELQTAGFLERYAIEGKRYIRIVNFLRHQKPHPRETPSVIPDNTKVSPRRAKVSPTKQKQTEQVDPSRRNGLGDLCLGDIGSSVSGNGDLGIGEWESVSPFQGEVFLQTWRAFVLHRKKKRAALTEHAVELIFDDFRAWGEAKSIQAIKNSIKGNWQGVFEPDGIRQSKTEVTMDAVREVIAGYEH